MTVRRSYFWRNAALVCVALALIWLSRQQDEPSYEGRPLSYYLEGITYGDLRREREAREAIQAMGSNGVPWLVEILDTREGRLKASLKELASRQRVLRLNVTSLKVRQTRAALACQELGPLAAAAIPALARLVEDPSVAGHAISALAHIGTQSFSILTNALLHGISCARLEAAGSMRHLRPPERPVPALLQALQDTDALVRAAAAETLGVLHAQPASVVPALRECLRDPDHSVRRTAARSLVLFEELARP